MPSPSIFILGLLLLSLRHYSSKSSTVLFLIGTTIAAVIMAFSKEAGIVACGVPLLFAVRSGLKRMESFQGFTFAIALSLIVALFYLVVRSLIGTREFVKSTIQTLPVAGRDECIRERRPGDDRAVFAHQHS